MNGSSAESLEAAHVGPVSLTKRGKDKLVILTAEQHRKLIGPSHSQAYGLLDAPQASHRELTTGLDCIIGTDNA